MHVLSTCDTRTTSKEMYHERWMVDLSQAHSLVAGDARQEAGAVYRPRSERRASAHTLA